MDEFLNGKGFLITAGAMALAVIIALAGPTGAAAPYETWQGLFFTIEAQSLPSWLPPVLSILSLGGTAALLILLNRRFNFIRAVTFMFAAVYLLLCAASLWLQSEFNIGVVLTLVLSALMFIIFREYQNSEHAQRSIFMAFAVVGLCGLFHYAALFLIPIVFIGFVQVQAMSVKGAVAALLGLTTPVWLAVGLGFVNPIYSFNAPDLKILWHSADFAHLQLPIIVAAITALVTIVVTTLNLMTVLNYRLQTRMYNAFIVIVAVIAVIAMAVDFTHILTYLPTLNMCLAIQIAHRATLNRR